MKEERKRQKERRRKNKFHIGQKWRSLKSKRTTWVTREQHNKKSPAIQCERQASFMHLDELQDSPPKIMFID
jgi:hypothetical protein